jgi:hypothetical protein
MHKTVDIGRLRMVLLALCNYSADSSDRVERALRQILDIFGVKGASDVQDE